MTYSAPVPAHSKQETVAVAPAAHHESFSRASHYAMAMVPMILAVGSIMVRDSLGQPAWQRVLVFAVFVFTISFVLFLLRGIDQVLDKNL